MDLGLSKKRVLVTGASQGIGYVLSKNFAAQGARVCGLARRGDRLEALVAELDGQSDDHCVVAGDLLDSTQLASILTTVKDDFGNPDIIVHCVGGHLDVRDITAPSTEWAKVWNLNLGVAIDINNHFLPAMSENNWGRIIHISSTAMKTSSGAPAYSVSKSALDAYTALLGRELAPRGVLVNAVMPSAVAGAGNNWHKAMTDKPEHIRQFAADHIPVGRIGTPEDLVPFVLLLASPLNTFATGSVFPVDGGHR